MLFCHCCKKQLTQEPSTFITKDNIYYFCSKCSEVFERLIANATITNRAKKDPIPD